MEPEEFAGQPNAAPDAIPTAMERQSNTIPGANRNPTAISSQPPTQVGRYTITHMNAGPVLLPSASRREHTSTSTIHSAQMPEPVVEVGATGVMPTINGGQVPSTINGYDLPRDRSLPNGHNPPPLRPSTLPSGRHPLPSRRNIPSLSNGVADVPAPAFRNNEDQSDRDNTLPELRAQLSRQLISGTATIEPTPTPANTPWAHRSPAADHTTPLQSTSAAQGGNTQLATGRTSLASNHSGLDGRSSNLLNLRLLATRAQERIQMSPSDAASPVDQNEPQANAGGGDPSPAQLDNSPQPNVGSSPVEDNVQSPVITVAANNSAANASSQAQSSAGRNMRLPTGRLATASLAVRISAMESASAERIRGLEARLRIQEQTNQQLFQNMQFQVNNSTYFNRCFQSVEQWMDSVSRGNPSYDPPHWPRPPADYRLPPPEVHSSSHNPYSTGERRYAAPGEPLDPDTVRQTFNQYAMRSQNPTQDWRTEMSAAMHDSISSGRFASRPADAAGTAASQPISAAPGNTVGSSAIAAPGTMAGTTSGPGVGRAAPSTAFPIHPIHQTGHLRDPVAASNVDPEMSVVGRHPPHSADPSHSEEYYPHGRPSPRAVADAGTSREREREPIPSDHSRAPDSFSPGPANEHRVSAHEAQHYSPPPIRSPPRFSADGRPWVSAAPHASPSGHRGVPFGHDQYHSGMHQPMSNPYAPNYGHSGNMGGYGSQPGYAASYGDRFAPPPSYSNQQPPPPPYSSYNPTSGRYNPSSGRYNSSVYAGPGRRNQTAGAPPRYNPGYYPARRYSASTQPGAANPGAGTNVEMGMTPRSRLNPNTSRATVAPSPVRSSRASTRQNRHGRPMTPKHEAEGSPSDKSPERKRSRRDPDSDQ